MEFARREQERRERGENPVATQSIGDMVMPMYPRKFQSNPARSKNKKELTNFSIELTQTLTAEDIDQINLLDDIEREIIRFSQNGGLSPIHLSGLDWSPALLRCFLAFSFTTRVFLNCFSLYCPFILGQGGLYVFILEWAVFFFRFPRGVVTISSQTTVFWHGVFFEKPFSNSLALVVDVHGSDPPAKELSHVIFLVLFLVRRPPLVRFIVIIIYFYLLDLR